MHPSYPAPNGACVNNGNFKGHDYYLYDENPFPSTTEPSEAERKEDNRFYLKVGLIVLGVMLAIGSIIAIAFPLS